MFDQIKLGEIYRFERTLETLRMRGMSIVGGLAFGAICI